MDEQRKEPRDGQRGWGVAMTPAQLLATFLPTIVDADLAQRRMRLELRRTAATVEARLAEAKASERNRAWWRAYDEQRGHVAQMPRRTA